MKHKKNKFYLHRYKKQIMREIFLFSSKDIDDIALYVPQLRGEDKLFVESNNPNDPRLMPAEHDNELYYEYGYLGTTIFLLNVIEFGKSYLHKDSYIYPALFCFRQYVENMIKVIARMYDPNVEFNSKKHNLMDYWATLLNYIEFDGVTTNIGKIIQELQKSDPHATAYRYPRALNSTYYKGKDPQLHSEFIDLNNLKTRVLQIYRFFDGLYEEASRSNIGHLKIK